MLMMLDLIIVFSFIMQFNPSTEYNSIVKNIRDLTDATENNFKLSQITRSANSYLDRAYHIIFQHSDKKNWDDPNFSSLPQGTYDLISGDRQITMSRDEEDKEILAVRKVIIRHENEDDTWSEVYPVDLTSDDYLLDDRTMGSPRYYDWVGQTLIWDIIPDYNRVGGVKVFYQRAGDYFVESDTTKSPGLPEHFHDYIVYGVAYEYAMRKGLARKDDLLRKVKELEADMAAFFGNQSIELNTAITPYHVDSR